jgi:hypothetical protein
MKYALLFMLFILNMNLSASWVSQSLEQLVEKSELIVKGKVEFVRKCDSDLLEKDNGVRSIRRNAFYDTAYIKIEKIYKVNDTLSFQVGDFVKVSTPLKSSFCDDSIKHSVGKNGIWLLRYYREIFNAAYPDRFQKMENENEIIKLVESEDSLKELIKFIDNFDHYGVKYLLSNYEFYTDHEKYKDYKKNPIYYLSLFFRSDFIHENMLENLINHGFTLNCKDNLGRTPLYNVLVNKIEKLDLLVLMLQNGADINVKSKAMISIYDLVDMHDNRNEILEMLNKYEKAEE